MGAVFFLGACLLLLIEMLFRVEQPTFRTSAKTLLFCALAFPALALILGLALEIFTTLLTASVLVAGTLLSTFTLFAYLQERYHHSSWLRSLGVYSVFVIMVCGIPWAVRAFVVSPYVVKGQSMYPSFDDRAYILATPLPVSIEQGDVVVFAYPKDPRRILVSRVVALPLEKISIDNGVSETVEVSKQPTPEDKENLKKQRATYSTELGGVYIWILGPREYFVLGDHRENSMDSRHFGPIAESAIHGKVFYTFSPEVSRALGSLFSWAES